MDSIVQVAPNLAECTAPVSVAPVRGDAISADYLRRCAGVLQYAREYGSGDHSVEHLPARAGGILACLRQNLGLGRETQEDAVVVFSWDILALGQRWSLRLTEVLDGCGGMAGGEVASALGAEAMTTSILASVHKHLSHGAPHSAPLDLRKTLTSAFWDANAAILAAARRDPALEGMAATCTAFILVDRIACIASAGDSRCYLFRQGSLRCLTKDHNRAQSLVDLGILSEEDARCHPCRSHLTNAIGIWNEPRDIPEVSTIQLQAGDLLISSTDGFHEGLSRRQLEGMCREHIAGTVTQSSLERLAELMESASLDGYGRDNVTLVLTYVPTVPWL